MSGPDAKRQDGLTRYIAYLQDLTAARLGELDEYCTPDISFRDPFNDVTGVEAYRRVLARMYEDVPSVDFNVEDWALNGERGFIRWRFSGRTKSGNPIVFEGVSTLTLDSEGRIAEHYDYWDPARALYEQAPILGTILKTIRRRLSAD